MAAQKADITNDDFGQHGRLVDGSETWRRV
jgi:hypothetical protein